MAIHRLVILAAVKSAEDGEDLIVRYYESAGRSATAVLTLPKPPTRVTRVNLLEDDMPEANPPTLAGNTVSLPLRPHEVVTLRVKF